MRNNHTHKARKAHPLSAASGTDLFSPFYPNSLNLPNLIPYKVLPPSYSIFKAIRIRDIVIN
jgi:hypothetical protein